MRTALWGDHAVGVLLPTQGQQPSLVADTFRRGDGARPATNPLAASGPYYFTAALFVYVRG